MLLALVAASADNTNKLKIYLRHALDGAETRTKLSLLSSMAKIIPHVMLGSSGVGDVLNARFRLDIKHQK